MGFKDFVNIFLIVCYNIHSIFNLLNLGVLNTIGRLFPGIIVYKTNISATSLCTVGMVGCAVTCFLFPLCKDFPSLMTFGAFFGFFIGMSDLCMNINNLQLFTTIFLTSSKYTLLQPSCHN